MRRHSDELRQKRFDPHTLSFPPTSDLDRSAFKLQSVYSFLLACVGSCSGFSHHAPGSIRRPADLGMGPFCSDKRASA